MISPAPGGAPSTPQSSPHQALLDTAAQQPQGNPNDLLKFLFDTPDFMTGYQKDVISAWMQSPAMGEAIKKEGAGPDAAPAGGAAPANPAQPSGPAQTGQPQPPVGPIGAPAAPTAPPVAPLGANPPKGK